MTVVSPEERARLLEALPLRVRLVAETLYVTGARVSEVLGVRRNSKKRPSNREVGSRRRDSLPVDVQHRVAVCPASCSAVDVPSLSS